MGGGVGEEKQRGDFRVKGRRARRPRLFFIDFREWPGTESNRRHADFQSNPAFF